MTHDGYAYELNVKFETVCCCECGALFGLPKENREHLIDTGSTFYCPNGHAQHYSRSTEDKLREAQAALKRERKRKEWAEQEAQNARQDAQAAKNQARAEKAAKTRLKNRIAKGVCPCCNRTFQNLQAHIATQHPEFASGESAS